MYPLPPVPSISYTTGDGLIPLYSSHRANDSWYQVMTNAGLSITAQAFPINHAQCIQDDSCRELMMAQIRALNCGMPLQRQMP